MIIRERRYRCLAAGVVTALVAVGGCRGRRDLASRTWPVMGTFATVSVPAAESERLDACVATVKSIFAGLEQELSIYREDSDLARLNRAAGRGAVAVASSTFDVLALSLRYAELTEGAFDPTVAPLVRLWGFSGGKRPASVPDTSLVEDGLAAVGYGRLRLDADRTRVELAEPGMVVDLGGIAKGYAVDRAWDALAAQGVENAIVNLGGNIRCLGRPKPGAGWRIGVRHPFTADAVLGVIELPPGAAVATSGHYERFVVIEGERYAHIIDPRTGRPVEGMAGVTVLGPTAAATDALSTAFFVLGPDGAPNLLEKVPDCAVVLVPDRQPPEMVVSRSMQAVLTPLPAMRARTRLLESMNAEVRAGLLQRQDSNL